MRVCGARGHRSGRGLFVVAGAPQPLAPDDPSLDAQSAQLERALAAITTVVFVASVSYVLLSAIFGCFCTGAAASRHQQPGGGETPAAVQKTTKRALEEIPVVVVQVPVPRRDPGTGSGSGSGGAAEEDGGGAGECAVCLAGYAAGEEVRVLPACRHGFHRDCVDRWLLARAPPTCPICRRALDAARAEAPDAKGRATAGDIVDAGLP